MTAPILDSSEALVCPRGSGLDLSPIVIDLKKIAQSEARLTEIQALTPQKAAELLSCFNICWRDLHRNVVLLEKEKNDAVRRADRVKGVILLDRLPGILTERGLFRAANPTGSEDIRNAILAMDPEYTEALERVSHIEAIIELLKGKLRSFDMAYNSVKKLISDPSFMLTHRNPNLGVIPAESDPEFEGFGKPSY